MSTRRPLLTACLLATLSASALAQPAAQSATDTTVTVKGTTPAAAPVTRDKDTLSVDFPDEDIKTILRNVADLFELNLVVPETLTGKTSIKLRDVTWRQIFQVVLAPAGYTYIEEGNIIKVVSSDQVDKEPPTTEVFVLNNAKAADIKPTVDGLIDSSKGGKIVIDSRSNALVITERPSQMKRIGSIIEQLDKPTDQVMIESKFVEVTDSDLRNIGVNWASLQGMSLGVSGINQTYNKSTGQSTSNGATTNNGTTVTYTTTPTGVSQTDGSFAPGTLNLPAGTTTNIPASVPANLGVTGFTPAVAPTQNTYDTNGNLLTAATPGTPATFTAPTTVNDTINNLLSLTNTGSTSRVATAVFSSSDFGIVVSALKTQDNTKIVSNPTIVTLNNTEATINIGQEFPVPSYTYNSERGSFEVSGFTYKPIGINLRVTPQVNGRGIIRLTVDPEVSQQNGSTSFGGAGGAQIPIIATRKVSTHVSLKDGYTMGIGGLMTSSQDHGGTSVPILGSIPLLGRLFSSKNTNDVTTNLLIFITAKTVSADGASPEEVFDPRAVAAVGMTKEDLPGNRAPAGTDLFKPATPPKPAFIRFKDGSDILTPVSGSTATPPSN